MSTALERSTNETAIGHNAVSMIDDKADAGHLNYGLVGSKVKVRCVRTGSRLALPWERLLVPAGRRGRRRLKIRRSGRHSSR